MSWFTDLAGKAEELLNKVDKSAAVVLKAEGGESPSSRRHYDYDTPQVENISLPNTSKTSQKTVYTKGLTRSSSAERSSPASSTKAKQQTSDEKLLEFLNSEEPVKKPLGLKSRTPSPAEKLNFEMPMSNEIKNDIPSIVQHVSVTEVVTDSVVSPPIESVKTSVSELHETTSTVEQTTEMSGVIITSQDVQPILNPRSLEFENRQFQSEINSLNQDLSRSLQKNKHNETEIKRLTKELEKNSAQKFGGDKVIRELQSRENDLKQALDAKDSQLAVLRVRLQEADLEISRLKELFDKTLIENKRIVDDNCSLSDLHGEALHSLQQLRQQSEDLMEREKTNFRSAQNESLQRIGKLEENLNSMVATLNETQTKMAEEKARNMELSGQLKLTKQMAESVQQEMSDYKVKAQRILQSKDKLIASLKEANSSCGSDLDKLEVSVVEFEELRHERDDLKEELLQANRQIVSLRTDIQDMENQMQEEVLMMRQRNREMEELLKEEREGRKEREREIMQLKEDIQYERESSNRQKANLQSRIQDRDSEIEKLRNQLIAKQVNSTSQAELESRLSTLTESLIQKQTILEALSTEKSSLVLQLERLEHQTRDQNAYNRRTAATAVNVNDDSDVRLRVPGFMMENPFDGQMTRKVKRVYNTIDTLSFRLGVFLRRYPMARILIIIYMVMLHLWVLIVLFTYSPEMHSTSYGSGGREPSR
ncbi:Golgin sub A member 5 [Chamberlinius hualienensis]